MVKGKSYKEMNLNKIIKQFTNKCNLSILAVLLLIVYVKERYSGKSFKKILTTFGLTTIMSYLVTDKLNKSLLTGVIITLILESFGMYYNKYELYENFENKESEDKSKDLEEDKSKDLEKDKSKDLEEDKSKDLKEDKSKDLEEDKSKDLENKDKNNKDIESDTITIDDISALIDTKDKVVDSKTPTGELDAFSAQKQIETLKSVMTELNDTVEHLAPTLKEGAKVMDMFKQLKLGF